MGRVLHPPSPNAPIVVDQKDPRRRIGLTPVWHKWFIDLVDLLNRSGGTSGAVPAVRVINTNSPLTGGGDLTIDRTLGFVPAGSSGNVQYNNGGVLGAIAGITVTITTAKLTPGGANGSMTFTNGVLTAQTQAT